MNREVVRLVPQPNTAESSDIRKTPNAFNLRMPDDLKLWLKAQAVENRRSLNEEIVYRLLQSKTAYRRTYD